VLPIVDVDVCGDNACMEQQSKDRASSAKVAETH
jgi:hypothetical protein